MRRHFSASRICCGSIKATSPSKMPHPAVQGRKKKNHMVSLTWTPCVQDRRKLRAQCTHNLRGCQLFIYLFSRGNEILISVKFRLTALLKFHIRISLKNPCCGTIFPGKSAWINLEVRLSSLYLNSARSFCFNTTLVNLNICIGPTDYSCWVLIKQLK